MGLASLADREGVRMSFVPKAYMCACSDTVPFSIDDKYRSRKGRQREDKLRNNASYLMFCRGRITWFLLLDSLYLKCHGDTYCDRISIAPRTSVAILIDSLLVAKVDFEKYNGLCLDRLVIRFIHLTSFAMRYSLGDYQVFKLSNIYFCPPGLNTLRTR